MPKKKKKNKPTKLKLKNSLDRLCREFVKLRDENTCQICFIHKDSTQQGTLDWSHYVSRRHLIVRWDPRNSIASCRKCHQEYGDGINSPMIQAINNKFGEATTHFIEKLTKMHPSIKGLPIDTIDYRLELVKRFKKEIAELKESL